MIGTVTAPTPQGGWVDQNKNEIMTLNVGLMCYLCKCCTVRWRCRWCVPVQKDMEPCVWRRRCWSFAGCLWMLNPWMWDSPDFRNHVPLSYCGFQTQTVPLFVWKKKKRLFSQSLEMRNLGLPVLDPVPWTSFQVFKSICFMPVVFKL